MRLSKTGLKLVKAKRANGLADLDLQRMMLIKVTGLFSQRYEGTKRTRTVAVIAGVSQIS